MASAALDLSLAPLVGAALLAVAVLHYLHYARGRIHLPGPVPWPIFGSLLQLGEVSRRCRWQGR